MKDGNFSMDKMILSVCPWGQLVSMRVSGEPYRGWLILIQPVVPSLIYFRLVLLHWMCCLNLCYFAK